MKDCHVYSLSCIQDSDAYPFVSPYSTQFSTPLVKFSKILFSKVNVQKLNFYLDNAIGCKYGTTFNIGKKGQLIVPPVACSDQPLKPHTSSGM